MLAEHCAEVYDKAKKPRPLFDFKRQSFERQIRILGRCGITDVMRSAPFEPVVGKNFKPEGSHIQLWMTLLEQVFTELTGYNVDLLEGLLSEEMEKEENKEMRKKLEAEVQASVRSCGRHLFPVHCPQQPEHLDGHWTLLSLEKADDKSPVKVRYFETLDTANEVCLSRANKLLKICGLDAKAERCNTFRQSGDDCTWWVLHYAELEARLQHSEGGGSCWAIGNALRKQQLRHCLQLATNQLGAARNKWLEDEEKQLAQAEAVRMMVKQKIGHIAYVRAELERLRQRAALAAEEIHKGTKDLADPEISVENKKKEAQEKMKISIDKALQEIEELGLAEELKKKAKQEEENNEEEGMDKQKMRRRGVSSRT